MSENQAKWMIWMICAITIGGGLALCCAPLTELSKDRIDTAVIMGCVLLTIGLTFFLLSAIVSIKQDARDRKKELM